MSIDPERQDMKSLEIIGFDATGKALVDTGDGKLARYRLFISPQNKVTAQKVEVTSTDQEGHSRPARVPVSERWRGVDQGVPTA